MLSDLHAVDDRNRIRSGPSMNYALDGAPRALLETCKNAVIAEFPGGIDLVLVAGDMTDKATPTALEAVWNDLHWFAESLDAPLVATSGNHDYDSRAKDDPLPYKSLLGLNPSFPAGSRQDRNKYFAEHHAVFIRDKALVVTANSAAHHGYAHSGSPEHTHGRYSNVLPDLLEDSLNELGATAPLPSIRVFLTHHHLNQLPNFDDEERSFTIGNEAVLRKLLDYGSWLVVHGHKHRGWIQYASGGGDAPPLLSSSSFSADLGEGPFVEKVRHQFHVIEIPTTSDTLDEEFTGARGRVTSWTHSPIGWQLASASEDLPGKSGYGWKTSIRQLASRIKIWLESEISASYLELLQFEPRIQYLTFDDERRLIDALKRESPRMRFLISETGGIEELSMVEE